MSRAAADSAGHSRIRAEPPSRRVQFAQRAISIGLGANVVPVPDEFCSQFSPDCRETRRAGDSAKATAAVSRARFPGVLALVLMMAVHAALLGWGARRHSPSWDEAAHLPAGLSHWQLATFDLYRVNPPLVRTVAALPVLFAGAEIHWEKHPTDPATRVDSHFARIFVRSNGERSFWFFTLARWACIPFSLLGAYICYLWACGLYGDFAGLLAAALWSFSPNMLANAQMITPDAAASSLGVAATYAFWRWLRRRGWKRAIVAGVAMGLAELTKTTWIVLFLIWPLLWLAWKYGGRSRTAQRVPRGELLQLAAMVVLSVYLINLGYTFEGSFQRLGDFKFVSATLAGDGEDAVGQRRVNRFTGTRLAAFPVPFPRNYIEGIDVQKLDFEKKHWSYLGGEWRFGGWWYYYLYALGIKVPLGTWLLLGLAAALSIFGRGYAAPWPNEMVVLAPAVVVLTIVSSQTGFGHHMRYVLPIFPFLFVWVSKLARAIDFKHRVVAYVASGALAWSVASSLWIFPHSLSYFNELVGGPIGGHAHLLHSNIDWGQDLLYLKRWLAQHPEADPIGLAYSLPKWLLDLKDVGMEYPLPPSGPHPKPGDWPIAGGETGPLPGWYAVCVGRLRDRDCQYAYFLRFKPVATAGYSIYIYHIGVDDANRVREELGLPEM